MNARAADGVADWRRARRSQATQTRQQAEHHRRLAEIWDERAAEFEAEIAHVEADRSLTPATEAAE
jgi:thymidylate kinase